MLYPSGVSGTLRSSRYPHRVFQGLLPTHVSPSPAHLHRLLRPLRPLRPRGGRRDRRVGLQRRLDPRRSRRRGLRGGVMSPATRRFTRHYVEMVIAMFVGMGVLGAPIAVLVEIESPALRLLNMAVTMTIGMVAWMRYRGHGWMPCAEMSASMFVPTFAAIGLMWAGTLELRRGDDARARGDAPEHARRDAAAARRVHRRPRPPRARRWRHERAREARRLRRGPRRAVRRRRARRRRDRRGAPGGRRGRRAAAGSTACMAAMPVRGLSVAAERRAAGRRGPRAAARRAPRSSASGSSTRAAAPCATSTSSTPSACT